MNSVVARSNNAGRKHFVPQVWPRVDVLAHKKVSKRLSYYSTFSTSYGVLTALKSFDQWKRIAAKAALQRLSFPGKMTARVSFKQDDVARAVRGAISGGVLVARVEISPNNGRIVIVAETPGGSRHTKTNPWDSEFEET